MTPRPHHRGTAEIAAAHGAGWRLLLAVGLFSAVVNLLNLTGSLFMMQVYDRVLASRSAETLGALTLIVGFLFVIMALIDVARARIMARLGARFQERLEGRVFEAGLAEGAAHADDAVALTGMRDLQAVQRLIGSPVLLAMFDAPWAPLFLLGLFVFHPLLALVALTGGTVLIVAAALNRGMTRAALQRASLAGRDADRAADLFRDEGEVIVALGMRGSSFARWRAARETALDAAMLASERSIGFTVFSRSFRLFLQSALLATGAWLVLAEKITPGAMLASSILMGRTLAPVEQVVAGWPVVQRALDGGRRLGALLSRRPPLGPRMVLPRPAARIEVRNLTVLPPGATAPTLRGVSFDLAPGQALGVIGVSGSGKSTLARALTGIWPAAGGHVRLGGAALDQYDPDHLGALIGYLPQQVTLFDGTIAENIARLNTNANPAAITNAAQLAAAHHLILDLPRGYDSVVSQTGGQLSGGQVQRIGLARALYGDPVLFVLDEPNAHLDNEGSAALNAAIRGIKARGGAVIIMAHRPTAIAECDLLLVLENGSRRAFGPRDEVLRAEVTNAGDIDRLRGQGGGVR